jgi:GntR family transcriptional regulator of arabinose operon
MREKAKYVQLFDKLKEDILQGVYQDGQRLPGENEMADGFGISRQTVRQALALLEQEGYIQRRQGSGTYVHKVEPKRRRTWTVGVIATYISEYIFPSILRGIEGELLEQGFFPMLSATANRVDNERRILEEYMDKQIDGLIVEGTKSALPNPNLPLYEKLREMGIPVVFFNGYYPALRDCVSVTMNDRQGGFDAVEYLVAKGHRNIGGIFKNDDMQGLGRYDGYARALLKNGLTFQDRWVTWFNSESRENLLTDEYGVTRLLEKLSQCTAVVCYNDEVAVKLERAFATHGIKVPEDKAIISFDNSPLGELAAAGLTSFDHLKESLGASAARKLISMMDGREEQSLVLDWNLVERVSV